MSGHTIERNFEELLKALGLPETDTQSLALTQSATKEMDRRFKKQFILKHHPDKQAQREAMAQKAVEEPIDPNLISFFKSLKNILIHLSTPDHAALEVEDLELLGRTLSRSSPPVRVFMLKQFEKHMPAEDWVYIILVMREQAPTVMPFYTYSSLDKGRFFHAFSVSSPDQKYAGLKGDALKTAILINFQKTLQACENIKLLISYIQNFTESAEFKILKTKQGLVSRILHKPNTALFAFYAICRAESQKKSDQDPSHLILIN